MSTDALRAALEADGQARIGAILGKAQEQVGRICADAQSLAAERRSEVLREAELQLRREGNRRLATARAEARKRTLEARDELLDRVFGAARQALSAALDGSEARSQLIRRSLRALSHMPDGPVVFTCSSDVAPILEAALTDRADVRVESDPEVAGGFRAVGGKGSLVVDATFPNLLDIDRPALAIAVLQRLDRDEHGRREE